MNAYLRIRLSFLIIKLKNNLKKLRSFKFTDLFFENSKCSEKTTVYSWFTHYHSLN